MSLSCTSFTPILASLRTTGRRPKAQTVEGSRGEVRLEGWGWVGGGEGRATAKWEEKGRDQATETQTVPLKRPSGGNLRLGCWLKGG